MVGTRDLTADKLFNVKDYVCVITGGGEINYDEGK
jgi:hypothetical protein